MNVRPTKTHKELADIVEKREKMLEEKKFTADRSIQARGIRTSAAILNPGGTIQITVRKRASGRTRRVVMESKNLAVGRNLVAVGARAKASKSAESRACCIKMNSRLANNYIFFSHSCEMVKLPTTS